MPLYCCLLLPLLPPPPLLLLPLLPLLLLSVCRQALAAKHGLPYRSMGELPLLAKNLRLYRDVARAPADPGARRSKGGVTI